MMSLRYHWILFVSSTQEKNLGYHFIIIMVISVFKIYKYVKVTSFLKICFVVVFTLGCQILSSLLSAQASKYNIGTNWFMISMKTFKLKFFLNRKQFIAASSKVQALTLSNTFIRIHGRVGNPG